MKCKVVMPEEQSLQNMVASRFFELILSACTNELQVGLKLCVGWQILLCTPVIEYGPSVILQPGIDIAEIVVKLSGGHVRLSDEGFVEATGMFELRVCFFGMFLGKGHRLT